MIHKKHQLFSRPNHPRSRPLKMKYRIGTSREETTSNSHKTQTVHNTLSTIKEKSLRWMPKKNASRAQFVIFSAKHYQQQAWRNGKKTEKGNAQLADDEISSAVTFRCVVPAAPRTYPRPNVPIVRAAEPQAKILPEQTPKQGQNQIVEQEDCTTPKTIKNKDKARALATEEEERIKIILREIDEKNIKKKSKKRKVEEAEKDDPGVLYKVGDALDTLVVGIVDILNPCVMFDDVGSECVYVKQALQLQCMQFEPQCTLDEFASEYFWTSD
mmetsp:Transcript_5927/g.12967  ORF Transcript_5927/g.12967 Transcript_5927/m.12967 type:complete len:271 (+) Transcript_5927:158-970(+)